MVRRGLNPCSRKLNRHELRLFDSSTLLDAWPPSLDHLGEAERLELKQRARIALLHHNAHYGPGGPYERSKIKGM